MLNNVMPQRATFFDLLGSHTDRLVAGANATMRLVSGLGNQGVDAAALIEEVNANESSADRIKADFIRLLYESFTTPINREQLHTLILDLDRILDTCKASPTRSRCTTSRDRRPRRGPWPRWRPMPACA